MALMHSTMPPLGRPAPDFDLPGTDGQRYSLASFSGKPVLVVIFMCNHCPYVKAVVDRLIRTPSGREACSLSASTPTTPPATPTIRLKI